MDDRRISILPCRRGSASLVRTPKPACTRRIASGLLHPSKATARPGHPRTALPRMSGSAGHVSNISNPHLAGPARYHRCQNVIFLLFSYGTLQYKSVQIANFGRELTGREDALPGYARRMVPILDPRVVASSGESHYANAEPSANPEDAVHGTVFVVTEQELAAADLYEEDADYRRISVTLRSGDQAWVYVHA